MLEIRKDGLVVCLDNGSVWNVSVGDHAKAICWYPTMRIVVEENKSLMYAFAVTNLDTDGPGTVRASRR